MHLNPIEFSAQIADGPGVVREQFAAAVEALIGWWDTGFILYLCGGRDRFDGWGWGWG